jgi:2-polyprenyl-3-methyl-5-hydroxy-6-metoxy-1,4-benzoquinol methylase
MGTRRGPIGLAAALAARSQARLPSAPVTAHEAHKQAEIDSRTPEFIAAESTKPFGWESYLWARWATVAEALRRLAIPRGAPVLDLGCGPGWTSLFLAESGYEVTAVDLVPANVELTAQRAARWGATVSAEVADMDELDLGRRFRFALIHDALHHSTRHRQVLVRVAEHLEPGGWLLLGETTWLHRHSPGAHRQTRQTGWVERGFKARALRADLRDAGFVEIRRFFQGTDPYESRGREFVWQLVRLGAANFAVAPQSALWLAGRRPL